MSSLPVLCQDTENYKEITGETKLTVHLLKGIDAVQQQITGYSRRNAKDSESCCLMAQL